MRILFHRLDLTSLVLGVWAMGAWRLKCGRVVFSTSESMRILFFTRLGPSQLNLRRLKLWVRLAFRPRKCGRVVFQTRLKACACSVLPVWAPHLVRRQKL
jgi:hypothetical protein